MFWPLFLALILLNSIRQAASSLVVEALCSCSCNMHKHAVKDVLKARIYSINIWSAVLDVIIYTYIHIIFNM